MIYSEGRVGCRLLPCKQQVNGSSPFASVSTHEAPQGVSAPRRVAFDSRQIFEYDPETAEEVADLQAKFPGLTVGADPGSTFLSFVMHPNREPWPYDRIRKAPPCAPNPPDRADSIVR